jgi:hypothetical protein
VYKGDFSVTVYTRAAGKPQALFNILGGEQSSRRAVYRAGEKSDPAAAAGSLAPAGCVDVHAGFHGCIKHGGSLCNAYARITGFECNCNSFHFVSGALVKNLDFMACHAGLPE